MVVGYLLVLAWNEDYGSATRSINAVTAAESMVEVPADVPSAPAAPALEADSDVPEMSIDPDLSSSFAIRCQRRPRPASGPMR